MREKLLTPPRDQHKYNFNFVSMRSVFLALVLLVFSIPALMAQEPLCTRSIYRPYEEGKMLYEKEQFSASRIAFEKFLNQPMDRNDPYVVLAQYFRGMAALALYHNDAILQLDQFNKNYPENTYKNAISFAIANFYFQQQDYTLATNYLEQTNPQRLDSSDLGSYFFKKGYGYFLSNRHDEAMAAFKNVKDNKGQYGITSLYYYSHIAYLKGQLDKAMPGFQKLKYQPSFTTIAPYYIVQINHKQGHYDSVITYATSLLDSSDLGNYNDVLHLLGDAYFKTNDFKSASIYLMEYNKKVKTSREDDYQLGIALMKSGNTENAIAYLERTGRLDDSLGHTAMYQVGQCYLDKEKLLPARNAFEKASDMRSNPIISEDALYQFAIISFQIDINPYDESVRAFEKYLKLYPNSTRKNDIYQYLVNVYSSTSNYEKALNSLNKIPNKDLQLKSVYQTVAYNLGVDLYQKSLYDSSYKVLALVEKYQEEPELIAKSRYWRADISFRNGNYSKSIQEYKGFLNSASVNLLEEKPFAYYSMAYAYLELDQISDALEYFGLFCQTEDKSSEKYLDALFQLADGNYQQGKDQQAINYYKTIAAMNTPLGDRCAYYLAKSYGYNKQSAMKISTLENLIRLYPRSKYVQMATYELAMTYKAQSDFSKAYEYFDTYVKTYKQSPKVINCRIEMADIYYKQYSYELSEKAYRSILIEYSGKNDVCAVAAKGLMDVYIAMKKPEAAEKVADEYDCAGLSSDDKENLYYNPALQNYVDSNYAEAIPKFEQYLNKFPNGRFSFDAHFYVANSYIKRKDTSQAIPHYQAYLSGPVSTFFEPVSLRLAAYYYDRKDFNQAYQFYTLLEKYAAKPNNIFTSKMGIMRSAYLLGKYAEAVNYADQVKNTAGLTQNNRLESEYVLGTGGFYLKNYSLALPSLKWITKNTTTVKAAEAKFIIACIHFSNNQLDSTLLLTKELVKMKPSYTYWVAKGLILQTKVYMTQEKYVEAHQTISSVIDFYPVKNDDGILSEAKQINEELEKLMNPEKKSEENPIKTIEIKTN